MQAHQAFQQQRPPNWVPYHIYQKQKGYHRPYQRYGGGYNGYYNNGYNNWQSNGYRRQEYSYPNRLPRV